MNIYIQPITILPDLGASKKENLHQDMSLSNNMKEMDATWSALQNLIIDQALNQSEWSSHLCLTYTCINKVVN
jgi:hypothetical protein